MTATAGYEVVESGGTTAEIERLVGWSLEFVADLNTRNLDRIGPWLCDATELWIPPSAPRVGGKRILRLLRIIFEQYEELSWAAERLYPVNPVTMITEVTSSGRFVGGRPYENRILTIQRFRSDGKLLQLSDYFKTTAVFGRGDRLSSSATERGPGEVS